MSLSIDYVEFTSEQLEATQDFFSNAFGWSFVDYGPDYREIQDAGLSGGVARDKNCAPLIILKSDNLERDLDAVLKAGGEVVQEIFEFPGGRRFHFREPGGTVMAIWQAL